MKLITKTKQDLFLEKLTLMYIFSAGAVYKSNYDEYTKEKFVKDLVDTAFEMAELVKKGGGLILLSRVRNYIQKYNDTQV